MNKKNDCQPANRYRRNIAMLELLLVIVIMSLFCTLALLGPMEVGGRMNDMVFILQHWDMLMIVPPLVCLVLAFHAGYAMGGVRR